MYNVGIKSAYMIQISKQTCMYVWNMKGMAEKRNHIENQRMNSNGKINYDT